MEQDAQTVGNAAFRIPFRVIDKQIQTLFKFLNVCTLDIAETFACIEFSHGKG